MAWYKKKDICRIYIFIYIYIRKCIEHVWSTQSHPWHINSLGFNFQRATGNQPFGFNKQVIVCQFHLCAYVHIRLPRFQGKSVAAADCQSLAHYWSPLDRNENGCTHTGVHTYLWTSVMTVMTDHRLAYFYKPGAFMFWGVGGCQEIKHCFFFCLFFSPSRMKNMAYT